MSSSSPNSSFAPFTPTLPARYPLGNYIIEDVLGKGGFGITYLAREEMTDYLVVIKENYPSDFAYRDPTTGELRPMPKCEESYCWALESFEKEARTLRKLPKHPNLVHITNVFRALNTAYIVMERIDGKNLAELYPIGSKMKPQLLEGILHKLLNALEPLHKRGIIHRDIKPGNIMLTTEGEPVLIDFGAARPTQGTHTATQIGTRGYAPPEQLEPTEYSENAVKQAPQPHWDLYALGCTCYQLITGYVPVSGARALSERPELQGLYSSALLASIDKAHEKDPADRWQSAQDWLDELSAQHKRKLEEDHRRKVEEEERRQRELEAEKQKAKSAQAALYDAKNKDRKAEYEYNGRTTSNGFFKYTAITGALLLASWLTMGYTNGPMRAVNWNCPNLLRSFLYLPGVDVNKADKYGYTPLYWAAWDGHTECVKLLIDAKADVNMAGKDGRTPLYRAASEGHTECVKLLINAPGINTDSYTPLCLAAMANDVEKLRNLLSSGNIDINAGDKDGYTPLYMAAWYGHTECVKLLIDAKADVNMADNWRSTPLYWAAGRGHTECVKLLIDARADVNKANPLVKAALGGHTECVKLLIAAGADVNKANDWGETPLYWAAKNGHTECVKLLIAAGADVNKATKYGFTPLRAAKTSEIKRLLRKAGAR